MPTQLIAYCPSINKVLIIFLDNFSFIQYCKKTGSYKGPEMLVLEDETEDLIQRFSAVSLMDCGKYGAFCRLLKTFANGLDPGQDQHNVGPDLDPNHLTL